MKAMLSYAILVILLLGVSGSAFAVTRVYDPFIPTPSDLYDLEHAKYYSWGISFALPEEEEITKATLYIYRLNNWAWESGDTLFIHLLDNPAVGVTTFNDTDSNNGHPPAYDNWTGQGVLIAAYHDYNEGVAVDKTYKLHDIGLVPTLTAYIRNNDRFGFGFDPDCHYYNCGIKFVIETEVEYKQPPVPEPTGLVALGAGMMSLVGLISRRRKL